MLFLVSGAEGVEERRRESRCVLEPLQKAHAAGTEPANNNKTRESTGPRVRTDRAQRKTQAWRSACVGALRWCAGRNSRQLAPWLQALPRAGLQEARVLSSSWWEACDQRAAWCSNIPPGLFRQRPGRIQTAQAGLCTRPMQKGGASAPPQSFGATSARPGLLCGPATGCVWPGALAAACKALAAWRLPCRVHRRGW